LPDDGAIPAGFLFAMIVGIFVIRSIFLRHKEVPGNKVGLDLLIGKPLSKSKDLPFEPDGYYQGRRASIRLWQGRYTTMWSRQARPACIVTTAVACRSPFRLSVSATNVFDKPGSFLYKEMRIRRYAKIRLPHDSTLINVVTVDSDDVESCTRWLESSNAQKFILELIALYRFDYIQVHDGLAKACRGALFADDEKLEKLSEVMDTLCNLADSLEARGQ
jgi:hypothetical protein